MTDRKRSKAEERIYTSFITEIHDLDIWHMQNRLKLRTIPPEWQMVEHDIPVRPKKTRVTIRLDSDLTSWFRKMGSGYQARINAVLRSYMLAVLSKEIERPTDRDWKGDPI